jgi:hypothetical protein
MSRQRQMTRIIVLESHVVGTYSTDLVARLAREAGCSEAELIVEAEELVTRFARAGASTWEAQLRIVAADHGIPVEELRAELADVETEMHTR